MERILERLGYSRSESLVYVTLLKSGPLTAGKISKNAQISRVAVYDALKRLLRDGIVNKTLNKSTQIFIAAHPKRIKLLLNEKEVQIKKDGEVVQEMFELFNESVQKSETKVYHGLSGLKVFYEECLDTAEEYWFVLGVPKRAELLGGYLQDLSQRRANKKIKLKIIFNKEAKSIIEVRKKQPLSQVRLLPDNFITPASIDILHDRVGIVLYAAEPVVFSLINKDIADSFKHYFDLIWKRSKKV